MNKLTSKPVFVEPSVELILEKDPFKKIEIAGRTCYKSEANITEESAKKFTKGIIKHQHTAMVEHAVEVFEIDAEHSPLDELSHLVNCLHEDPYLHITSEFFVDHIRILASGNIRSILQRCINDPLYRALVESYPEFDTIECDEVQFPNVSAKIIDIEEIVDLTYNEFLQHFNFTCRFITDRGVSHEMVRHRPFSFAQESTRYCNYNKDQFGGRVSWCRPTTYGTWTEDQKAAFEYGLLTAEDTYRYLTNHDSPLQPQQARAILPNALKTEIVVTGPAYEWKHFFNLRSYGTTGAPHPDIKIVADLALNKINQYIDSLDFERDFKF